MSGEMHMLFKQRPMSPEELRDHIYSTYFHLRVGLCVIAFAFPILLWGIGWLNSIGLQGSLSEYYFAFAPENSPLRVFPGRVLFVGILFALGVALYLYKGLTTFENVMLNFAAVAALAAALLPMQPPKYCENCGTPIPYLHTVAGLVVFGCLIAVAWDCANKSAVNSRTDRQKWWFPKIYRAIAVMMFFLPVTAVVMAAWFGINDTRLFIVETLILWSFGAYWGVRSIELWLTEAEKDAMKGIS
jgi:hypothetical protein